MWDANLATQVQFPPLAYKLRITDVDLRQVNNFCSIAHLQEWALIASCKLTINKITWVCKSKKWEILFEQIFRLSSSDFCLLIFFRVSCQRNLNLSELSELIRTIQTCQKYPNLCELSKCVRTIQTCQNYPNVTKLLNVSASSERISIIQTSQHHLNVLSSFEHGKLVNYSTL